MKHEKMVNHGKHGKQSEHGRKRDNKLFEIGLLFVVEIRNVGEPTRVYSDRKS